MTSLVKRVCKSLDNPVLVARIQSFFGIEFLKVRSLGSKTDKRSEQKDHYEMPMLDALVCVYSIHSRFFYYFFQVVTSMGNEIFYILFLPILVWNFNEKIAFLTTTSWAFSMYLGQVSKDLLQMPRPATPPVVKLEYRFLKEYGFPSTHAMAASSISFTLLRLLFIEFNRPEHADFRHTVLLASLIVPFLVCLSRLYLGMHSVLDVLVGSLYALGLSLLFLQVSHLFQSLVRHSFTNGLFIYLLIFLAGLAYPCNNRQLAQQSTARSDTFLILGVAGGLVVGYSLKNALGLADIGKLTSNESGQSWVLLMRFLVGALCVQLTRYVSNKTLCGLISRMSFEADMVSDSKRDAKEHIKSHFYLDLSFYFFCYTSVAFSAIFTSFFLFHYLNLC